MNTRQRPCGLRAYIGTATRLLAAFALMAGQAAAEPASPPPARVVPGLVVSSVASPPTGPGVRIAQPFGRRGPTSLRDLPPRYGRARLSMTESAPSGPGLIVSYAGADTGGNTSVANDGSDIFKWSGASPFAHEDWGHFAPHGTEVPYVKRDRDLGQTFTYDGEEPARLEAITLRTGFGTDVVRPGTYGQAVSLQLFRVSGDAVVHDNGTTGAASARHGFPHNRTSAPIPAERDDYLTGEHYAPIVVAGGARFPSKADFGLDKAVPADPDDKRLKGRYLRWDLDPDSQVVLEPGATYAFLVMIDEAGPERGFTLANHYRGAYPGGHGIRRDGNGTFPPAPADPSKAFHDPENAAAIASAHFPKELAARVAIPPGTNGYPDVDTWRDLSFWIEIAGGK